jgi:hypothetical protein
MDAQLLVGNPSPGLRNTQRISTAIGIRLGTMKERFSTLNDRRPTWRQRFLAIAREMEAAAAPRRESIALAQAVRRKFSQTRTLRGIRLGCIRAA